MTPTYDELLAEAQSTENRSIEVVKESVRKMDRGFTGEALWAALYMQRLEVFNAITLLNESIKVIRALPPARRPTFTEAQWQDLDKLMSSTWRCIQLLDRLCERDLAEAGVSRW